MQKIFKHINIMINIDKILKEQKLTKIEVAKKMKISTVRLYGILSGNPTLDNLVKLSNTLNVPITELFEQPATEYITCPHCKGKIKIEKV